ncbi:MAG TPA: proton-conducting transporter membrane subunit [Candidatus Limiplasma sp.]|nr:proton-conducting transporter membrane subunit [Candidatus Limiplasma sp.]HRX09584.1 proton-conducting transporter membrane subunit [Candidatus Limiplasma sp.]
MALDILKNPVLLIAVPLLLAFLAVFLKKIDKALLWIAAVANAASAVLLAVVYQGMTVVELGGFKPPFGISLVLDEYSLIGVVVLNVLFALILLLSGKLVKQYATVLLVALAALNGIILTGDLFNLFVFLEIAAIAAYIFTAMDKGFKHSFNYLVVGTLGSGLYLFGIILLYNIFGSLNMFDIRAQLQAIGGAGAETLTLPLVMIFTGLSVEAKLMPFGGWVKGVLHKANSLVGTMIVSGYALAVLLAVGRLMDTVFQMTDAVLIAFTAVAVGTLIFAEASAFSKKNLREILLFSSVAQAGLVVLLFLYGLTVPAVLVLVNNVVSKFVLFTVAGRLAHALETDDIGELKGVFVKVPLVGVGFTVAVMSLIGLPLFFGFVAKINALVGLFNAGNVWLPLIILVMAVVEGAYFVRILTTLWNTGEEGEVSSRDNLKAFNLDGMKGLGVVSVGIAIVIVALGILPVLNIKQFFSVDFMTFVQQLLGGM